MNSIWFGATPHSEDNRLSFLIAAAVTTIVGLTVYRTVHNCRHVAFNAMTNTIPTSAAPLEQGGMRMLGATMTQSNFDIATFVLSKGLSRYAQLPTVESGKRFTATTIPNGLLHLHSLKKGSWGLIRVSQGRLEYQIHRTSGTENDSDDQPQVQSTYILDPSLLGIIEPTIRHQVRPLTDDVEFVVEFYKATDGVSNIIGKN